ncbi:MAG TPA: hypothetical protein VF912_13135 [Anaeromyxobacter sp.]
MRKAARLLALVGAIGVGWLLFGARAHDVVLVYDVSGSPGATALDVELRSGGALVRRARIAVRPGEQVRHPVRLRDGAYALAWRLERPGGTASGDKDLTISGEQTIVLPLSP